MPPVKKPAHDRNKTCIRAWRKFRGFSQQEVADRIETTQGNYSRLERGEQPYDQDVLEKLSFVFLCDVDDLLSNDPLRPNPPRLISSQIRTASPDLQRRILAVVEAMLKAG